MTIRTHPLTQIVRTGSGSPPLAGIHVHLLMISINIAITRNDTEETATLKARLFMEFGMKDLEKLKYFLEIEVTRSNRRFFISSQKYFIDIIEENQRLTFLAIWDLSED
ncbi:hypothetical protein KSP39_PZI005274 [Platanthera zijinensis]|uniref:Uncharacterized protein n=1 Tax=Platanthera zijinensis TaxID=2320716 RepID=A0AAP0BSW6_9ASPA